MNSKVCVFGEVLFDCFADGQRVLGGAPFNVAWHLQAFGLAPLLISRLGDDADGAAVRKAMRTWGMDDSAVGIDPQRPTGRVEVSFTGGEPSYDIVPDCAYDAIEMPSPVTYDLLYHGSLAARDEISRATLDKLRAARNNSAGKHGMVFVDVNLRPPWWHKEDIHRELDGADWVKLNHDELLLLHPESNHSEAPLQDLLARHELKGVIVTHGSRGAQLLNNQGEHHSISPRADIQVVDTVGAGDAFSSVVILGLLQHWPLPQLLARAQDFASQVVGIRGATTTDPGFYAAFVDQWQAGS